MFSEEELRQFNEGNAALDEWIDALEDGKPANATYKAIVRCNRGACTGTIKPNGRCIRCNQEPLKESK